MTTNIPSGGPSSRPGEPAVAETKTMPVVTPTAVGGVGGVAVFDRDVEGRSPSVSTVDDRGPAEVRSSGSVMTWIIGAILLIVLAYFLMQMLF